MKKIACFFIFFVITSSLRHISAQTVSGASSGNYPPLVTFTTEQDHQNMMEQLGIKALRPGKDPNAGSTNLPNYDTSLANPYPNLPNPLVLNNGQAVTSAAMWWKERRPEIVKDFSKDVYGSVPAHTPKVTWEVQYIDHEYVGRMPVIVKQLIGHVDNSSYPLISVDIKMTLVLPEHVKDKVPLLIMFGQARPPAPSQPYPQELDVLNAALKKLLISEDTAVKGIFERHPAFQMIRQAPGTGFAAFFAPPPPKKPGPEDVPGVLGVNNDPPVMCSLSRQDGDLHTLILIAFSRITEPD